MLYIKTRRFEEGLGRGPADPAKAKPNGPAIQFRARTTSEELAAREVVVDLAGDVALQQADHLSFGFASLRRLSM